MKADIDMAVAEEEAEDDDNNAEHIPSFADLDLNELALLKGEVVERFF